MAHYSQRSCDVKLWWFVFVRVKRQCSSTVCTDLNPQQEGERLGLDYLRLWPSSRKKFWFRDVFELHSFWHFLFVFTKSNNTVVTLQSAFWCFNVVSHIKESEVASFSDNPRPQLLTSREVVSFQTADFHGCTVTSIQPQKLFRGLSVSARCTYCQWGNQKREESSYTEWRRVVLLQMCGYTIVVSTYPILPFQKESGMTGLFTEAPE